MHYYLLLSKINAIANWNGRYVDVWINSTNNGTQRWSQAGDFFASFPLVETWTVLTQGCDGTRTDSNENNNVSVMKEISLV